MFVSKDMNDILMFLGELLCRLGLGHIEGSRYVIYIRDPGQFTYERREYITCKYCKKEFRCHTSTSPLR